MDNLPAICAELRLRSDGGVAYASSLDIAERFGKQHKDVLRAIDRLSTETSEEFARRNFALSEYVDSTGRTLRCFNLTRDGFSMVTFGFTGADAVAWQEKYILGFNAMEALLRSALPSLDEIGNMFRKEIEPVREELSEIRNHQVRHDGNIAYLIQVTGEHRDQLGNLVPERNFSKEDKRRFAFVVSEKYSRECPCCRDVKIIDEQGEPIRGIAHCDHVRGRNIVGPYDGWYVCYKCNEKLKGYEARAESMGAHREFIRLLKKIFSGHPAKEHKKISGPSPQNSFEF